MSDLTIKEIIEKKRALEVNITNQLGEFVNETGLAIELSCSFDREASLKAKANIHAFQFKVRNPF